MRQIMRQARYVCYNKPPGQDTDIVISGILLKAELFSPAFSLNCEKPPSEATSLYQGFMCVVNLSHF